MNVADSVVQAVNDAKNALTGMVLVGSLIKRTPSAYIPGTPISYTESVSNIDVLITSFTFKEVDGTLIKSTDAKIIAFVDNIIPEPDDFIVVNSVQYRCLKAEHVYAGSVIVLSTLQGRPQ